MKSSFSQNYFSLFLLGLLLSCRPSSIELKKLDLAIANRDFPALLNFAKNSNSELSKQAYRALYNTSGSADSLFKLVISQPSELGFFALSNAKLSASQINELKTKVNSDLKSFKKNIIQLVGAKADMSNFDWAKKEWENSIGTPLEETTAFALGKHLFTSGVPDSLMPKWIERAIAKTDEAHIRAYLYGTYRVKSNMIQQPYNSQLFDFFISNEKKLSTLSKQYFLKAIAKQSNYELLDWISAQDIKTTPVGLQIEMAKALSFYLFSKQHNDVALNLLSSPYPIVISEFFASVSPVMPWNEKVKEQILSLANQKTDRFDLLTLKAQDFAFKGFSNPITLTESDLKEAILSHPYSLNAVFKLAEFSLDANTQFSIISELWNQIPTQSKASASAQVIYLANKINQTQNTALSALFSTWLEQKDRVVLINLSEVLGNKSLSKLLDLNELLDVLNSLDPIADIEVFQAYLGFLMQQNSPKATKVLQKLAQSENKPIADNLKSAGYLGEIKPVKSNLSVPNRARLAELGDSPKWVLTTEKGEIEIKLDAIRNPFTVWLIDSLSRTNLLNNVAFHRVVTHFVIQGGDFERGDGYGGCATTIPTEASELEFERGALGMASAGTDTESGQYFIMHQWNPHLNGRYTRFGMVTKGIDVVDQISVGDIVLNSQISRN